MRRTFVVASTPKVIALAGRLQPLQRMVAACASRRFRLFRQLRVEVQKHVHIHMQSVPQNNAQTFPEKTTNRTEKKIDLVLVTANGYI